MPTNSTAKAIDSSVSDVTIIRPTAVVIANPMNSVADTATMIFGERNASQRITSTISTVPTPLTTAPS